MRASEVAVLQVLVDEGGVDTPVPASLTLLRERTGVARSTLQLALAALAESGHVEVVAAVGKPSLYRVLSTGPITGPTTGPIDPPDRPDPTGPIAAPPSRASAPDKKPLPLLPHGSQYESRAGAEADRTDIGIPTGPTGPTVPTGPTEGDVVEPGQAVVAWAVDEQRRLGKAPLDGALLGRIGSVAKRMIEGGVSAVDLKLAVETLVQRDMTDLQAAHRKAQSGEGSLVSTRASGSELDRLAVEAAASKATRDRSSLGSQPQHMPEVWWFLAWQWGRLYGSAEQAEWAEALRPFPVGAILAALRDLSRNGEHKRWPPTCGEVYRVTLPLVLDARRQRELRDLHESE